MPGSLKSSGFPSFVFSLAFIFSSLWVMSLEIVMGSGYPKTRIPGGKPDFLGTRPKPDFCYPNPSLVFIYFQEETKNSAALGSALRARYVFQGGEEVLSFSHSIGQQERSNERCILPHKDAKSVSKSFHFSLLFTLTSFRFIKSGFSNLT